MGIPMFVKKLIRKAEEHAPEIMFCGGVLSLIGTVVSACNDTVKAIDVMNKYQEDMDAIKKAEEVITEETPVITLSDGTTYTADDIKRDKKVAVINLAKGMLKTYWKTIVLLLLTFTMFFGSFGIINKRLVGTAAALSEVSDTFQKYRSRVQKKYGKDEELRIYRNEDWSERAKDTGLVDADGSPVYDTETIVNTDTKEGGPLFSRVFDKTNKNWDPYPEYNFMFLCRKQDQLNDTLKLRVDGVVTLNEVYVALGFPQTELGSVYGWVWENGDEYIDFGLYNVYNAGKKGEGIRRFINGFENAVLLDFNCTSLIGKRPKA